MSVGMTRVTATVCRQNFAVVCFLILCACFRGLSLPCSPDSVLLHIREDPSNFAQTQDQENRKLTKIDMPSHKKGVIGNNLYEGCLMALIFWFLGFMIVGDLLAYLIGLFVEYQWGSYVSLVAFLALYFSSLWVAWLLSVWVTEPKKAAA